jgi:hypothetical protein
MDGSEDVGEGNGDLSITKMFLRLAPFLSTVKTGIFLSSSSSYSGFFSSLLAIFPGV